MYGSIVHPRGRETLAGLQFELIGVAVAELLRGWEETQNRNLMLGRLASSDTRRVIGVPHWVMYFGELCPLCVVGLFL